MRVATPVAIAAAVVIWLVAPSPERVRWRVSEPGRPEVTYVMFPIEGALIVTDDGKEHPLRRAVIVEEDELGSTSVGVYVGQVGIGRVQLQLLTAIPPPSLRERELMLEGLNAVLRQRRDAHYRHVNVEPDDTSIRVELRDRKNAGFLLYSVWEFSANSEVVTPTTYSTATVVGAMLRTGVRLSAVCIGLAAVISRWRGRALRLQGGG